MARLLALMCLALVACSLGSASSITPGLDAGGDSAPDIDLGDDDADSESDTDADTDGDADSDHDIDTDSSADTDSDSGGQDQPICYSEPIDGQADLTDLEQGFTGWGWLDTVLTVLERRYASGHELISQMRNDPQMAGFADVSSFAALMESLMTIVHEETHGWDYEHAMWGQAFVYFLSGDLQIETSWVDGFPRSELYDLLEDDSTSLYADTYLVGQQGTYGFVELLDEMNAYINGLAALSTVGEYVQWGISGRDGALAFLYYLELYLGRARTVYPDLYAELRSEPAFATLVETQWLRTHFFLEVSSAFPELGIDDAEIADHVYAEDNLHELELFVDKELSASSCL